MTREEWLAGIEAVDAAMRDWRPAPVLVSPEQYRLLVAAGDPRVRSA